MSVDETRRRSRGVVFLLWVSLALGIYGIAAVFGLGRLDEALEPVPLSGFIGGVFVGLSVIGIPAAAAWSVGRPLNVVPMFPRATGFLLWLGVVGMAVIGLTAVLVDIGFLNLVIVNEP